MRYERGIEYSIKALLPLAIIIWLTWYILSLEIIWVPMLFGLLFHIFLSPQITWFQSKGLSESASFWIVYIIFIILSLIAGWLMIEYLQNEFAQLIEKTPEAFGRIKDSVIAYQKDIVRHTPYLKTLDIGEQALDKLRDFAPTAIAATPQYIFNLVLITILTPFFTFFMLKDGSRIVHNIIELIPNRYFEMTMVLLHRIERQMSDYIRGRMIEAMIVTILIIFSIKLFGLSHAGLYGVFGGVTILIPYIGPAIGLLVGLFVAVVEYSTPDMILLVMTILLAVQVIDMIIIAPLAIGMSVDVHPLVVFIGLILGGDLAGFLGLIIAIPVIVIAKIILQESYKTVVVYSYPNKE
jgi:putative permease